MDGRTAEISAALFGLFTGAAAAAFWSAHSSSTAALRRISAAPSARVSDLRSLLGDADDKLVVVRGQVQPEPAGWLPWLGIKNNPGALVAEQSGKPAVIVQQINKCLDGSGQFQDSLGSVRSVPFILVDGGQWRNSAQVHVSLDELTHPLPLTTVYKHSQILQSPSNSTGTTSGQMYPVRISNKESILPIGKEITAVGICRNCDEFLEIKSCMKLPYFLSDMTKDEMEAELARKVRSHFWAGVVLGTLCISALGYTAYAIIRDWQRRKELRNRRPNQESSSEEQPRSNANDNLEDVTED